MTAVPGQASDRDRAEWTSVVEAVVALASSCRSLEELEAKIAEQSSALRKPPENAVVLSTIHSAKGLEWDAVLMVGMEEGVVPHANNDDLEEERRVAYVGVTRAKRILGLTYANERFRQNSKPSRFLHELAGREQRLCIWTGPRSDGADERLPLLSERERQRLKDGPLSERGPQRKAKEKSSKRAAGRGKDRIARNKNDGAPPRHGLSWSAAEDDRLRALFVAGEAIAAIADAHQRKRGAITARLIKLGLITEDGVVLSD